MVGIVEAVAGAGKGEDGGQADSAHCTINMNQTSTDWGKYFCPKEAVHICIVTVAKLYLLASGLKYISSVIWLQNLLVRY
jgi:hypothetical protein